MLPQEINQLDTVAHYRCLQVVAVQVLLQLLLADVSRLVSVYVLHHLQKILAVQKIIQVSLLHLCTIGFEELVYHAQAYRHSLCLPTF